MKTPRTDNAAFEANFSGTVFDVVDAYFARQLEIELADAKAKLRKLRKQRKKNDKKENELSEIIKAAAFGVGKNWLHVQVALVEYLARGRGENVKWLLSEYAKFKESEK